MQLSKVTSWGLILGGLLGILGFMAFGLALGLLVPVAHWITLAD